MLFNYMQLRRRDGAQPGVFNKGVASSKVAPKKGARVRGGASTLQPPPR
jgi:hypothetical protein